MDGANSNIAQTKKELKRILESIERVKNNDQTSSIRELMLYLNQLLRIRLITPPISEVMILLQSEKPILYHTTRLALSKSSHIYMLFEIKGDATVAAERLTEFKRTL